MPRIDKRFTLTLLAASVVCLTPAMESSARNALDITYYYTMVNKNLSSRDCSGEGNQIVNGQLYGSDCRPIRTYCRYGMGVRNTCLRPCQDGAGDRTFAFGQYYKVPAFTCPWGPLKGQTITQVRIVDVGGGVRGNHIDIFVGLCRSTSSGVCRQFEETNTMVAQYNGVGGDNEQLASAAMGRPAVTDSGQ